MIEFFVKRPITTLMFVMLWVVLGIVAFGDMNVERSPKIDMPMVTATLLYPGAGPAEIETQIVKRVEDAISRLSGIKKITSTVYDNYAFIVTEFNLSESAMEKQQEVKAAIDGIIHRLPDGMEQPIVRRLNINQQTVIDLAISGADLRQAFEYVDKVLSRRISGIPGVAEVEVFGGRSRAIRVFLDPQRMTARGVSVTSILTSIANHNLNIPAGKIETQLSSNAIRFMGEFTTLEEVASMPIVTSEGMRFQLKDVADVLDSHRDPTTGGRFLNDEVLIMSIAMAEDGNAVRISDTIKRRMDRYNEMVKQGLGEAAQIRVIADAARSIRNEVDGTLNGIIIGIILTLLTLLFFTRSWRSTIIAGIVIPTSIVAGFLFMSMSNFTINTMTLLAVACALGTLIANAIVLIEASLNLMNEGIKPIDAAVRGTKKVFVAITACMGTSLVVFLPLAMMDGIAGMFMKPFGLTIVYLTITSFMFSITLTPMMIAKFLRPIKNAKLPKLAWYKPCFDSQMKRPWAWIGLSVVLLLSSSVLMKYVGSEFSSAVDTDEIHIFARAPMGSTYENTLRLAKAIEAKLDEIPEVLNASVRMGRRGIQNVNVVANLLPLSQRESDKTIAQRMVMAMADIPGAEFQIRAGEAGGGPGGVADMVLNVVGDDDTDREATADELIRRINTIEEIQSAILGAQEATDEIQFIPNPRKMNQWGAKNSDVGAAIRTAFFGDDTMVFREKGEEYPLIVEFARNRRTIDSFNELLISTSRGMVPVSELGDIVFRQASRNIYRVDRHRMTEIMVNLGKSTIGPVRGLIMNEIRQIQMADGVRIIFGGSAEMQDETNSEMASTFMLATLLTLMLLAAIMNSIGHSIKISASIFSSFAGVFVFLFLSGASMNISAMMAIIMLVGLAVNTEILLLQPAVVEIENGRPPASALWEQYIDKFRMVLMTTIAVITGMIPQLFSPNGARISMAAVLIGGMVGGLLFTFILTPALFIVVENMRDRMFGIDRGNKIGRAAWLWMKITGIRRDLVHGVPYPMGCIGKFISRLVPKAKVKS